MRKNVFKKNKLLAKIITVLSVYALTLCCLTACAGTDKNTDSVRQTDPVSETDAAPETENASDKIPVQETAPSNTESETGSDLPTDTSDAESTAESTEESSTTPEEPVIDDTANMKDWELAYYEYLNALESNASFTYSLIYVDDDNIPELVIDTGYEAGGCMLLTWHNNRTDVLQTSRLYFNYIEKENLLCNQEGNMGYYYDDVYTIKNGKWEYLCGGTYQDGPDGPAVDDEGNSIYIYAWNGENTSKEEYDEKLNAVYQLDQSVEPEKYYILDEILSVLKTGDVTSAGHRYELIVEDLTWTDADAACKKKGGYLATITSFEEWDRITKQIASEEKNNITFWVGARDVCWLEPGIEGGYPMLALYNALFQFWLEGEPSYRGHREDGVEVAEEYVVLFYRKSDDCYYLNDVPDNILAAAPSYAGRIGYICEYDE